MEEKMNRVRKIVCSCLTGLKADYTYNNAAKRIDFSVKGLFRGRDGKGWFSLDENCCLIGIELPVEVDASEKTEMDMLREYILLSNLGNQKAQIMLEQSMGCLYATRFLYCGSHIPTEEDIQDNLQILARFSSSYRQMLETHLAHVRENTAARQLRNAQKEKEGDSGQVMQARLEAWFSGERLATAACEGQKA